MKNLLSIFLFLNLATIAFSEETKLLLEEKFDAPLSKKDWFWGLGTWTAKDGVLRGFESGPRRHGPVKLRNFSFKDGQVEYEFRITGKAAFAGIMFNGSQERGHIVHLVVAKDQVRILAHPRKSVNVDLLKQDHKITIGVWHQVHVIIKGQEITAIIDGEKFTASAPCIAEEKQNFGLGGDSGGPDGEKAGALEFRNLKIRALK